MLYLLPDEFLVTIVEYCDHNTRKNLSLVSRRLRNPSQSIIFKALFISKSTLITIATAEGGRHLLEVFQNDRLLSYIQNFVIDPGTAYYHLDMSILVPIFTALPQMQQLSDIKICDIPFTTTMLDQLCEVLSTRLCNVQLWSCSYPTDYTIQQTALKIHTLVLLLGRSQIYDVAPLTTTKAPVAINEKSLSSITSLSLSSGLDLLADLGTIPRLTGLSIMLEGPSNDEGLSNFLVANPQLVEFALDGSYDLSLLPPSALPNLTTILVNNAEMIRHLVPGRPVAKVEIFGYSKYEIMMDGLQALSRSTAPIVERTLPFHYYLNALYDALEAVVKVAPRLERISLSFRAQGRRILYRDVLLASFDHSFLAVANSPQTSCQTRLTARGRSIDSRQYRATAGRRL